MLFNRKLLEKKRNFAADYIKLDHYSKIFIEGAELLKDSLDILAINPQNILELGARNGLFTRILQKYYPAAQFTVTECSKTMLKTIDANKVLMDEEIDIENIGRNFDLIASNMNLHYINKLPEFLYKIMSMLSPSGKFVATFVGEASLHNFRKALIEAESIVGARHYQRIIPFVKASDISQILLNLGYKNIFVDVSKFTIENISMLELARYLKKIGENNLMFRQNNWTISKALFNAMDNFKNINDEYYILTLAAEKPYAV